MRGFGFLLLGMLAACASPRDVPRAPAGSCDVADTTLSGEVFGDVCGNVTAQGSLTILSIDILRVGPGTVLEIPAGESIDVDGILELNGTLDQPIQILSTEGWNGINVTGRLRGQFTKISGQFGSINQSDGVVTLADVELDLLSPITGPDCTSVSGGSMQLDHVHFTGCHCPLHIDGSTGAVSVTSSLLDGASNPIMIGASSDVQVHGNHLLGVSSPLYDLGGGVSGDFAGNYYGGGAPNVDSDDPAQFANADDFEEQPIGGVGPRFSL